MFCFFLCLYIPLFLRYWQLGFLKILAQGFVDKTGEPENYHLTQGGLISLQATIFSLLRQINAVSNYYEKLCLKIVSDDEKLADLLVSGLFCFSFTKEFGR